MKNFIIILMLLMSYKVSAQSSVIKYDSCIAKKFCLDCGDSKAMFDGGESLSEYFQSKVDKQKLKGIKGSLYLQVIVDEVSNVCLKSISNATSATIEQVQSLQLDKIIENMKGWRAAKTKGKPEIVSLTLLMNIEDSGELTVDYQRMGRISIE